uniref:All trans-polyprenyl-diphosphate synthase PDSS1 n=1 Tax=Macaca mulatta TaxID=9544 RepID=F7H1E7_MACMU
MSEYYFDGKGKAFRPIIVALMARACNIHHNNSRHVQASQRTIALIAEMIHTASLVHDDVIDDASSRRGKHTVNKIWGEKKAVLAGDLILSAASIALARIGNTTVISILTQVIEDLVRGEFLQLGSKENENERFAHYLEKTFKKTASLIANSCKAVSVLGCPDPVVHEIAYQYGKNVGIAFQLIDDVLDFTSCSDQMGKPTSADLKLGLATGPVLFACQQGFPSNSWFRGFKKSFGDFWRSPRDDSTLPFPRNECYDHAKVQFAGRCRQSSTVCVTGKTIFKRKAAAGTTWQSPLIQKCKH